MRAEREHLLLTVTEVAKLLRVSPETIREYHRHKLLHGVQVVPGGRVLFTWDELERFTGREL